MFLSFIRTAMDMNAIASIIISVSLMLFLGFAMTRLTKRFRLPNVTAYILTGILIGPYCADLIPSAIIESMDFLSDIALAFIAFGTGEFFKLSTLKKSGVKVAVLTILRPAWPLRRFLPSPTSFWGWIWYSALCSPPWPQPPLRPPP